MGGKAWTEQESAVVLERYAEEGAEPIAAELGRTINAVQLHAKKLKVVKNHGDPQLGDKVNYFEVIGEPYMRPRTAGGKQVKMVPVRCECGTEKEVAMQSLKNGTTKSCGCYNRKAASERMYKMSVKEDLPIGYRSGRLTVVGKSFFMDFAKGRLKYAVCECDCGEFSVVSSTYLRLKTTQSCGCARDEASGNRFRTHGMSQTRIYREWAGMIQRCTNPNGVSWEHYGGRGISVCDEWMESFESFRDWSYENGYADDLSIDRKDNNGNYCPENCRWGDIIVQANNRSNNRRETCWGEAKTVAEWSRDPRCQVSHEILQDRLQTLGWPIETALTTPKLFSKTG